MAITYFHQGFSLSRCSSPARTAPFSRSAASSPSAKSSTPTPSLVGGGSQTGPIDYTVDSHNILNKKTDPATGWSYHGARWMAPETARWLTPDPPVKAPDPKFLREPFDLHPYQYVRQTP